MARKYTKRDDKYWNRIKPGAEASAPAAVTEAAFTPFPSVDEVSMEGERKQIFATGGVSNASCSVGGRNNLVNNWAPAIANYELYPNLSAGIMPFSAGAGGYYTMQIPINLATLAYFNVPLVRNTIDLLQDFSISPLHIRTENATIKAFFTKWFEAIALPNFMSQWFLEYYRSGNIFIYTFNGRIAEDKMAKMKRAFGSEMHETAAAKSPEIPIRYIILDPKQVALQVGPNYKGTYMRMLSTFELQRLRDPKTPEDRQTLRDFPLDIQKQIKQNASQPWIYAPLDTSRLYYCFYRKQDYEPLAVPMIWPLLNRLEYKMMLEKADMSLVQSMEQIFIHIAAGESVDKNKGILGTNPRMLENLRSIFQSGTIGRYLVTDHTVKLDYIVPDLKDLLGKAKYEQVDKDIREGLGYAFLGEEKFANAAIKAKLFIENLREGRRVFLDNFLRPEVKRLCEVMGFRQVPILEFEEIDAEDKNAQHRIYAQMAQMGILTPPELFRALQEGLLPTDEESVLNQEEYIKQRKKGMYTPLAPAKEDGEQGRPEGGGTKMPGKKVGKIGTKAFAMGAIVDNVRAITNLREEVEAACKKLAKTKKLNEAQVKFADAMAKAIVVNEPKDKWGEMVATYIREPKNIEAKVLNEISDIAVEMQTDAWSATALWMSQTEKTE